MLSYLKRVTRIDSCRDPASVQTLDGQKHHHHIHQHHHNHHLRHREHHKQQEHQQTSANYFGILPEVRLVSASLASVANSSDATASPPIVIRRRVRKNRTKSISCESREVNQNNNSKRLFLSVSRTRFSSLSPNRSSRQSLSSGFKSAPSDNSAMNSDSEELNNHIPDLKCSFSQRCRRRIDNLSEDSSKTSPTTLCPTIASALWRPLWPPGIMFIFIIFFIAFSLQEFY